MGAKSCTMQFDLRKLTMHDEAVRSLQSSSCSTKPFRPRVAMLVDACIGDGPCLLSGSTLPVAWSVRVHLGMPYLRTAFRNEHVPELKSSRVLWMASFLD